MNIIVTRENLPDRAVQGYCKVTAEIFVDQRLDCHTQRETVLHEILEAYFPTLHHEMIEELTAALTDALDALEEK